MIIDVHTHAYPEKVAARAKEHLEQNFKMRLVDEPTVSALVRHMDANGVDISVLCAVAIRPEQVRGINEWAFSQRQARIKVFAALHPDYPDWPDELERIRRAADGIKFQPEFQGFFVDEERLFPLYERIASFNLPVLFHCGKELSGSGLVRGSPERIARVHRAFPKLTIVGAHFGGYLMWDEVRKHLLGTDIYLETSDFLTYLSTKETVDLIKGHRPDRLMFGTDFPLVDQGKDIAALKALNLPAELEEGIFSGNAARLLGI